MGRDVSAEGEAGCELLVAVGEFAFVGSFHVDLGFIVIFIEKCWALIRY